MRRHLVALMLLAVCGLHIGADSYPGKVLREEVPRKEAPRKEMPDAVARGRDALRGQPAMNPAMWSASALDRVWRQWGLKEKPADFQRRLRDRYGLHSASYDNDALPMGLHWSRGITGKGVVNDCLLCHAGVVAGQTIIGLGNASLDLQGLFDELSASETLSIKLPFHFSHVRGTIDPIGPVAYLMGLRDADLNVQKPVSLDISDNVCSDPPAWWLLKKKKIRNWTGSVDMRAARIDMVNLLTPFNSSDHIKKQEPVFKDIHAFIMTVEPPRYPFPIDARQAARGRDIFNRACARCHGTYGPDARYPNKVVPLEDIGTDAALALAITRKNLDYLNKSWFAQEKGPEGQDFRIAEQHGYQAPPLDGVWATAPYFHNRSAPTLYNVLNSRTRPKIFTRSYETGKDDYDAINVGWKIAILDESPSPKLHAIERRKIYDTTLPGRSNAGHTFGDSLKEDERRAVIEYLKGL
ncbi:MAG: c-type cytochrome [Planctomycetes bacterium]|nr:c-type cytochrome [Planctomycetota bacterium]